MECGKCGATQEEGFLVDIVTPGTSVLEPQGERTVWARGSRADVRGAPWYASLLSGMGFPLSQVETVPVRARRCTACGFLEFYALPD